MLLSPHKELKKLKQKHTPKSGDVNIYKYYRLYYLAFLQINKINPIAKILKIY